MRAQEVEASVSCDSATALQPGKQEWKLCLKNKKQRNTGSDSDFSHTEDVEFRMISFTIISAYKIGGNIKLEQKYRGKVACIR